MHANEWGEYFTPVERDATAKAETDALCYKSDLVKICEHLSGKSQIICHTIE
jgi:hypothetical protein